MQLSSISCHFREGFEFIFIFIFIEFVSIFSEKLTLFLERSRTEIRLGT